MSKFKQEAQAFVERIIATKDPKKVRLQVRQNIDRGGRALNPVYLLNRDDERFNQPSTTVGWLTVSVAMLIEANEDFEGFVEKLGNDPDGQMNGYDYVDCGLVDPIFELSGQHAHLALRVVETTQPTEYDAQHPERAKRMGPQGDWLVDSSGELIFSYVQVGMVYPELGKGVFAGAGTTAKTVQLNRNGNVVSLPSDLHQTIEYADTISDPHQAMPTYSMNIVEDVAEEIEASEKATVQ